MNNFDVLRDLTQSQYEKAVQAEGYSAVEIMGYRRLALPAGCGASAVCICEHNGGTRLRSRLAYLIREKEKAFARNFADTPKPATKEVR